MNTKRYIVGLWPYSGYGLITFDVEADSEDQALDIAVCMAEKKCPCVLTEIDDIDMEDQDNLEQFMYVDATMEGANRPYLVDALNLKIIAA